MTGAKHPDLFARDPAPSPAAAPAFDWRAPAPARKPHMFDWPDPAAPSYFDLVAARGWLLIRRFRQHVDCSLMRSEFWPSAEDYQRDPSCQCDHCWWLRRTRFDGTPDARGIAARALQSRIRRYAP